jgi:hypothetical protein
MAADRDRARIHDRVDEQIAQQAHPMQQTDRDAFAAHKGPSWRDLREWLALVESHQSLLRIAQEVDPCEELAAITFMAARRKPSPAFLFERFPKNPLGARILTNMLAASKERYALAIGLDPGLSLREMIAATRGIVKTRIPPIWVPKDAAPVNEVVTSGMDLDLTRLPVPTFWPADGGPFICTGGVMITADPMSGRLNVGIYRQQLHSANRIGLNFVPGRHGALDCEAARGRKASRARSSPRSASIRCYLWSDRSDSLAPNPSSTSPAASWDVRSSSPLRNSCRCRSRRAPRS